MARRTGTFTVDAQTLDLDGLMAFLAAATPAGARGQRVGGGCPSAPPPPPFPLQLDITVRARKGRALGIAFSNLETAGRMRGGAVALEGLKMEVFGGRFAGSAGFDGSPARAAVSSGAARSRTSTCLRSSRLPARLDR